MNEVKRVADGSMPAPEHEAGGGFSREDAEHVMDVNEGTTAERKDRQNILMGNPRGTPVSKELMQKAYPGDYDDEDNGGGDDTEPAKPAPPHYSGVRP